jgi:PAS domain S-box-containing protein
LPSLILRLEHLAQPPVPPEHPAVVQLPDVEAEQAVDDEPTQVADLADESDESDESTVPAALPDPPARQRARTVDVIATERLSSSTSLSRWSAAVAAAHDGCFVLDVGGAFISVSVAGVELLGSGDSTIIGRHILDVVKLVDLETGAANPEYAPRITPLVALENPGLARSLMRVRHDGATVVTLDASSAPIHDAAGDLLGSMTFISPIPAR